jgi:hypothetical protein
VFVAGHTMLDFESLSAGKPTPVADAEDMKRVWALTSELGLEKEEHGSVGWDIGLIAGQCSQGADPLAVFTRVTPLGAPLEVQAVAAFPLPEGIQHLRLDEIADAVRKAATSLDGTV